jgi:hypothetical protein
MAGKHSRDHHAAMDSPATPVFTFAAQPGAAAHASSVAPTAVAEPAEALDGAAEFAPRPTSRKERLRRLLLASRQLQQR